MMPSRLRLALAIAAIGAGAACAGDPPPLVPPPEPREPPPFAFEVPPHAGPAPSAPPIADAGPPTPTLVRVTRSGPHRPAPRVLFASGSAVIRSSSEADLAEFLA